MGDLEGLIPWETQWQLQAKGMVAVAAEGRNQKQGSQQQGSAAEKSAAGQVALGQAPVGWSAGQGSIPGSVQHGSQFTAGQSGMGQSVESAVVVEAALVQESEAVESVQGRGQRGRAGTQSVGSGKKAKAGQGRGKVLARKIRGDEVGLGMSAGALEDQRVEAGAVEAAMPAVGQAVGGSEAAGVGESVKGIAIPSRL